MSVSRCSRWSAECARAAPVINPHPASGAATRKLSRRAPQLPRSEGYTAWRISRCGSQPGSTWVSSPLASQSRTNLTRNKSNGAVYRPPSARCSRQFSVASHHGAGIRIGQRDLLVRVIRSNAGSDRGQLSSMARQAREVMGPETLSVVADRGYSRARKSWLATMPTSSHMYPSR